MSAAAPALTVYMPAYNVARYVRPAVRSILEQTFTDFEFIVIDDGSTDATLAVLRELQASDPRIRLITRANQGVSATANEAIGLARGAFLARIDGDDIALPQRLERQVDYLRRTPQCVAVGSNVLLIDDQGLPLFPLPDLQYGHEKIEAAFWRGGWPMVQPACTFRTDAVRAVGGYRPHLSLHEDHDLFLSLAERGRLENLPEILQQYRQRFDSLTFSESASSRKVIAGILEDARRRRGLPEGAALEDSSAAPEAAAVSASEASSAATALKRCRNWAWMSLKANHVRTARKYARQTVWLAPFSADSWKLMYCALRGR